ncbi:MAG: response regulator [Thermodesulfobacteriota bacterium]|nr:response regulator [Thermodesulfobacteriota bacterium]
MKKNDFTILIADDDEDIRLLYQIELIEEGYNVFLAKNGKEVLEIIQKSLPDLVILDINMPVMNGLEALGRIVSSDKKIPVILNTAYSSYKGSFLSWAAEKYVIKSSDLKELKDAIKKIFDKKREKE